jgi:late competence protein required for DNA uptake (superfamily II DNA/RNA helicase)
MRTGSWDSLSVLKPENTLHLLSHASLPCNDVYIRTCQHAKVIKLLQSLFEQHPGNVPLHSYVQWSALGDDG